MSPQAYSASEVRRGAGSPGTGVVTVVSCYVDDRNKHAGFLEEQPVLSTAEPSLLPNLVVFGIGSHYLAPAVLETTM